MAKQSSLIFISGGVRSGKSSFAERLAANIVNQTAGNLHYIAAGQSSDPEMEMRIARHQKDRTKSGLNWKTWEQPRDLKRLSRVFTSNDVVLLDCLTTLLNNEFFTKEDLWKESFFQEQIMCSIIEGVGEIAKSCRALIIVSNEVLNEMINNNELVFTYGRMLGSLHQQIVTIAKEAYLVEAGIPVRMKGVDGHEGSHDSRNCI
ncbi:bifunctional adenosylcobinamide kinase/adenosylcobinamide-phosphate guanylyltransferase [Cytobacillus solani]|uniref:bifunctional adenosylcobinamide kinase/adenosylcobinamide-phosphate guanylyltransferase n=1 Tax=Cytobacillus solani TaxID=1637975 RepID=UPI0020795FD3|nr:bifunctional adenosylcobinamide kinase/adenosylcobinamide-phosphate guanylyltransferase [Cytobacillus solani]USK55463.1 bifunctional adenosylcobinamide kinase/adenosylcobinamide-phosphate guanylyltransferase [Cytobacillus solani]